jgi:type I restriction enzyme M protein
LFIDARNYYTVVDRTLNEWSAWQLKNINAIVWLYRGETEKYKALLAEYRTALGSDKPFAEQIEEITAKIEKLRAEAKAAVENAAKRDKKNVQKEYDEKLAGINETLTTVKEANWLYGKFGEGVYADIPGLCKIADRAEIEEKGYSLTPGAYVGVAPAEDDGVDFKQRMKEIHAELLALQKESNDLMKTISQNLKEMGL